MHWYFFSVLAKEPCKVTFTILNNKRKGELFKDGMQIAAFDEANPTKGWHRAGDDIFYYKSNVDHKYYKTKSDIDKSEK